MSRTIRRKNAWDKNNYVPTSLDAADLEFYYGEGRYLGRNGYRGAGKFHGCTEEQILKKINAWFHRELPDNWSDSSRIKEYSRWYLRRTNEQELVRAIYNGEEDSLLLTSRRQVKGDRWYYD